ncbi:MAG: hypothetical protein GY842_08705, partial [bacterium]|nr:hypothetical protein [bacterium]
MSVTLLLYWFLVVVAAVLVARAAPRQYGTVIGLTCAGFWVGLVWSRVGESGWADGGVAAAAFLGAAGIALLGQVASDGVRSGGNRSVSRGWRWGKSWLRRTPAGPEAGSGRGGED